jgi:hypothetical protein
MALLLHLGMPKTGSKALQNLVMRKRELLAANGIGVGEAFRDGVWHRRLFTGDGSSIRESLRDDIKGHKNVLYSYEAGYTASSDTVSEISSESPTRIMIYLRSPSAWVNSYFNQMLKAHRVKYEEIVSFDPAGSHIDSLLSVDEHINRWLGISPGIDVSMSAYAKDGSVFETFGLWLGVPNLIDGESAKDHGQGLEGPFDPNPAANLQTLRILFQFKKIFKDLDKEDLAIAMAVPHKHMRGFRRGGDRQSVNFISKEEERFIYNKYLFRYQELLKKFGISQRPVEKEYFDVNENRNELEKYSVDEKDYAHFLADEAMKCIRETK